MKNGINYRALGSGGPNNGLAQAIRDALAERPMTLYELEAALRVSREIIRNSIRDMSVRTGGVMAVEGTSPRQFANFGWVKLTQKATPTRGSGQFAQPVREREFKPLRRDPFALMKLAMETRR